MSRRQVVQIELETKHLAKLLSEKLDVPEAEIYAALQEIIKSA